jgi:hypothetical protein
MRLLPVLLLLLAACTTTRDPEVVPDSLPDHCETKARLPTPPHARDRSIDQLVAFARSAMRAGNAGINERDACAIYYARLRAACGTRWGCIIPPKGPPK